MLVIVGCLFLDMLDAEEAMEEEEVTTAPAANQYRPAASPPPTQAQAVTSIPAPTSPPVWMQIKKSPFWMAFPVDEHTSCGTDAGYPTDIGECEFSGYKDTIYLPTGRLYSCLQRQRVGNKTNLVQTHKKLFDTIHKIQFPTDCAKPVRPWHLVKLPTFGVGSSLMHFGGALYINWAKFSVPQMLPNSPWRFSDGKCGIGYSCYLAPLSKCTVDEVAATDPKQVIAGHDEPEIGKDGQVRWPTVDETTPTPYILFTGTVAYGRRSVQAARNV
jgi:hypothetical protein